MWREVFFSPPENIGKKCFVRFEIRYDCLGDSSVREVGIKARHEGWASSHKLNETTR